MALLLADTNSQKIKLVEKSKLIGLENLNNIPFKNTRNPTLNVISGKNSWFCFFHFILSNFFTLHVLFYKMLFKNFLIYVNNRKKNVFLFEKYTKIYKMTWSVAITLDHVYVPRNKCFLLILNKKLIDIKMLSPFIFIGWCK